MAVRAKFICQSVQPTPYGNTQVFMSPVTDDSPEDRAFWEATPAGAIQLNIRNDAAVAHFEPGQRYYVDFTKAPA